MNKNGHICVLDILTKAIAKLPNGQLKQDLRAVKRLVNWKKKSNSSADVGATVIRVAIKKKARQ